LFAKIARKLSSKEQSGCALGGDYGACRRKGVGSYGKLIFLSVILQIWCCNKEKG